MRIEIKYRDGVEEVYANVASAVVEDDWLVMTAENEEADDGLMMTRIRAESLEKIVAI